MSSWVRYHFRHLRRWREYAEKIARAAKDIVPEAEVYVIGGVAEDRVTVLSDIDILVVVRTLDKQARRRLKIDILERAIDAYNLPWDAPVELHLVDGVEAERYIRASRKMIRIA